jgi:hypothetical protein
MALVMIGMVYEIPSHEIWDPSRKWIVEEELKRGR